LNGLRSKLVFFKVNDDWIDEKVFNELQAQLVESGSSKRYSYTDDGQSFLLFCMGPMKTAELRKIASIEINLI